MTNQSHTELAAQITAYLCGGGLWNPELADHTVVRDLLIACRAALESPERVQGEAAPRWIVNDMGELGVEVAGRFFFLYKGDNIVYGEDDSPVALHDDGTPMKYRMVGKREFGEVCYPLKWLIEGRTQHRYTEELVYTPGLSFGSPEDGAWKELPAPTPPERQGANVGRPCKVGGPCVATATSPCACRELAAPTQPTAPAQASEEADEAITAHMELASKYALACVSMDSDAIDDYWDAVAASFSAALRASTPAARGPLTDEQIEDLRGEANRGFNIERDEYFKAFRDAEFIHGIVAKESST